MWQDKLKTLGVNIHVVATGAGAGLQKMLWEVPGCSSYFSGASFPYAVEEQEALLGFMPEHFCSEEAAVDLASAAYMKAYQFGGKKPVGLGLTASVASEKAHRGYHRMHACIITNDCVRTAHHTLEKGSGDQVRTYDGKMADDLGWFLLIDTLAASETQSTHPDHPYHYHDASTLAWDRFIAHPFLAATGKRSDKLPEGRYALMPGAFNPPHEGHLGVAQAAMTDYNYRTIFEVTADPPHKEALTVQQLLQRAKLLQGNDRLFTTKLPYYLDKARKYQKRPLVLGADAMVRLLDPKWGMEPYEMFEAFYDFGTKLFVCSREVDGVMTSCEDIINDIKRSQPFKVWASARIVMQPLEGEWDISSTELREKAEQTPNNE